MSDRPQEKVGRDRDHEPSVRGGKALTLDPGLLPRLVQYFSAGSQLREEAEDLAQNTYALALAKLHTLRNEDALLPWLFAIARNVHHSALRRHSLRRRREADLDLAADHAAPNTDDAAVDVDGLASHKRRRALECAILRLPPRQRQCLLLQLREDLSYDEIARALLIAPDTVRNHLAQARANLRRLMEADAEESR